MSTLAAVAAAGLLAGLSADPAAAPALPPDVVAEATTVRWEGETNRYVLEGGVVVRRGLVTLRARAATLDVTTGEVLAQGGVLLTDATRVVSADGVRALLGGSFEAEGVVAFLKEGPVELGRAETVEDARRAGANRVSFSGARLQGDPGGRRLRLDDARLTLCDCGGAAPSWELRARRAEVVAGERATLSWPVLWITPRFLLVDRPVPVLVLPWLYLPLGDRHTGLLFPTVGSTGATGLTVSQPLFVTLGRSADATLTAEWMAGRGGSADPARGKVSGPGLRLELRWAPAREAAGEVELHGVDDGDREPFGAGGRRLGIAGTHRQRLGEATTLQADVALGSDAVWFRDFTADVLARARSYARSDLLVSRRSDALVLELSAAYLQPLAPVGQPAGLAYGTFGVDVPTFHRWPSLAATLLPVGLGPIALSGRAGLSRFATSTRERGNLGFGPGDPFPFGVVAAGRGLVATPREEVTRLDARASASAPVRLGPAVLEPYLRGAAAGYFTDSEETVLTAWAVGGASLSTELSRAYGQAVHRLVPRLELRGVTGAAAGGSGSLFPGAYDAWDRTPTGSVVGQVLTTDPTAPAFQVGRSVRTLSAAPDGRTGQARLAVESRLDGPAGRLHLEVGQDYDLGAGRFGETFFSGLAVRAPFTADVAGRVLAFEGREVPALRPKYRSWLDRFTLLRGGVGIADRRGDGLHASLFAIGPGASGLLMAGVDPLFDLRPASTEPIAQGAVGARAVLGPATIGYDLLVPVRPIDVVGDDGGLRRLGPWDPQQHTGSVTWDSPCKCFAARLVVRVDDRGRFNVSSLTLDLSRLAQRARVE